MYNFWIKKNAPSFFQANSDSILRVSISAQTFFGARHGLETLSQLIVFDDATNSLEVKS